MIPNRQFPWWFYLCGIVLAVLFWMSGDSIAGAQQPNPQACDNWLLELLPEIEQAQLEHAAFYGYLFQGLPTHSSIPADSTTYADMFYARPTDQLEGWAEFLPMLSPTTMPCRLTINVYEGATGIGYDVFAEYQEQNRAQQLIVCQRIEAIGAEAKQRRGNKRGWSCE